MAYASWSKATSQRCGKRSPAAISARATGHGSLQSGRPSRASCYGSPAWSRASGICRRSCRRNETQLPIVLGECVRTSAERLVSAVGAEASPKRQHGNYCQPRDADRDAEKKPQPERAVAFVPAGGEVPSRDNIKRDKQNHASPITRDRSLRLPIRQVNHVSVGACRDACRPQPSGSALRQHDGERVSLVHRKAPSRRSDGR